MDKEKIHIDEQFIDHSWQEMNQLLDREMPVQKKKRRFFWLWFIGLGLLVSGIVYLISPNPKPSIESFKITKKTPVAIQTNKNNSKEIEIEKEHLTTNKSHSISKKSTDDSKESYAINNLTIASPAQTPTPATVSGAGNSFSNLASENNLINSKINDRLNFSETSLIDLKPSIKRGILEQKEKIIWQDFDLLPAHQSSFLPVNNFVVPIPQPTLKQKGNRHLGVYGAINFPSLGGWNGGLYSNWKLNPKWSIQLGLGFSNRIPYSSNKNEDLAPLATLSDKEMDMDMPETTGASPISNPDTSMDNTGGFGADDLSNQQSSEVISYKKFHYFELPLLLQYQVNSRFSVELGGQLSRLYGFQYQSQEASIYSTGLFQSTNADVRMVEQNSPTIKRWDYGLLGGMAYKITPKLQAYSNFHYGLNNYFTAPANSKKWRQVQIGLRVCLTK